MDSLYDRLGGAAAVEAAVTIFYRKVMEDYRVNNFFENVDMNKQMAKQKAFLTMAFGGPNHYTGKDMRTAHAPLVAKGLNSKHFDIILEHLTDTLKKLGVSNSDVAEAVVIANSVRDDVLGKTKE